MVFSSGWYYGQKIGSDPFLKWSELVIREEKWGLSRFFFMARNEHWLLDGFGAANSKNELGQTRFKFGEIWKRIG